MNTLKQIKSRFPYMFAGQNIGISIARGWEPLFSELCQEIDRLLGADKQGFHWTQCKEKFGAARFYWTMKSRTPTFKVDIISESGDVTSLVKRGQGKTPSTVSEKIDALVDKATRETQRACIICGQPGATNNDESFVLVLCPDHAADRRAGRLKPTQIWPEDDEE